MKLNPMALKTPAALPTQLSVPAPPTRASRLQVKWFPKAAVWFVPWSPILAAVVLFVSSSMLPTTGRE